MNIILCGMMGAGKTTVGQKLATLLGRCWYDTDDVITENHGNISDIFARFGEAYFRELETKVVEELTKKDGLVLSVGGGLVLKEENVRLLKKTGKIVYLRATVDTLEKRLSADTTRPLLKNGEGGLRARLETLNQTRGGVYQNVADYAVDVDKKSVEKVAEEVAAFFL